MLYAVPRHTTKQTASAVTATAQQFDFQHHRSLSSVLKITQTFTALKLSPPVDCRVPAIPHHLETATEAHGWWQEGSPSRNSFPRGEVGETFKTSLLNGLLSSQHTAQELPAPSGLLATLRFPKAQRWQCTFTQALILLWLVYDFASLLCYF